MDNLWGYGFEA